MKKRNNNWGPLVSKTVEPWRASEVHAPTDGRTVVCARCQQPRNYGEACPRCERPKVEATA